MAFTKLHGTILYSSVWGLQQHVKIVWITLLALADENGEVQASVDGLARLAVVSVEECEEAIDCFLGPDKYSRDGTEGQRIAKIPGGWLLLNHQKYRDKQTREQAKAAARARRYRVRRNATGVTNHDITSDADAEADAEAGSTGVELDSARARKPKPKKPKKRKPKWTVVPEDWEPTAKHRELASELGVDLAKELPRFRDHEFAKPKTDADAAFRTWLRNAAEWMPVPGPGRGSQRVGRPETPQEASDRRMARIATLEAAEKAGATEDELERLADETLFGRGQR